MRSLTINLSLAVAATFGLAAFSNTVRAADMPVEYPPIIEAPEPLPLAAVGGWYLRGDIGYKLYQKPKGSIGNRQWGGYDSGGGTVDTWPYTVGNHDQMINEKMLGALDVGVGAGYKFNDYLRADVVFDYETPAKFKGSIWCQDAGTCGDRRLYRQRARQDRSLQRACQRLCRSWQLPRRDPLYRRRHRRVLSADQRRSERGQGARRQQP